LLALLLSGAANLLALAADNESVLTSISHRYADTVLLSGSARSVTLTVPFSYPGSSLDLSNGLDISYDEDLYKAVVAEPSAEAEVGGAAVDLTVTYLGIDEDEGDPKSTTVYSVNVVRAPSVAADFSGAIAKTGLFPGTIRFDQADFADRYTRNDGDEMTHVRIIGSNLLVGKLRFGESDYTLGEPIPVSRLDELTFVTSMAGTVSYDVRAYAGGDTSSPVGTAVLTITVSALPVPQITGEILKSVSAGSSASFSAETFTGRCSLNGGTLQSVRIVPGSGAFGTWYVNGSPVSGSFTVAASDLSGLSFRGTSAGTVQFEWSVSNEAGFSGYGTGAIAVSVPTLSLSSYSASSSLFKGETWAVSSSQFSSSPAGVSLTYIKITAAPVSADASLTLSVDLPKNDSAGYPAIAAGKNLSVGAVIPRGYLSYLRLVTKSSAKNSFVSFSWTATTDSMVRSAVWADTPASYTVYFCSAGSVSYETDLNIPFSLVASDFSEEFEDATGRSLSYVTITPPDASVGKFYEDYDAKTGKGKTVSASKKFYVTAGSAGSGISSLTFVPAEGYTGTVTASYKAYSSGNYSAEGTLRITVNRSAGGTVSYTTDKNEEVRLDAGDFAKAFQTATNEKLSYVRFSIPSSSVGKLYYNYSSSYDYEATVSSSGKYYVYSQPYLSYVTFVPHNDYTGSVNILYTAYDQDGDSYQGKLRISVVDSPAGIVSYSAVAGEPVQLSAEDFADEFIAVTGSVLSYVKWKLPAAASGVLYQGYTDEKSPGAKVSASANYYNGSSPDLSDITFVPAAGFLGKITISYTAYNAGGTAFEGKLKITVGQVTAGSVSYTSEDGSPIALKGSDFGQRFYEQTGVYLSHVTFSLPSHTYGRLYYGYDSSANTGISVFAGTPYYVNGSPSLYSVSFVPRSGYTGSFTIDYTGYDFNGNAYAGNLKITVGNSESGTVQYETNLNTKVTFSASDFQTAYYNETGGTLSYVRFELPSSSEGKLYYSYSSSSNSGSQVSSGTKYYLSGYPYLSSVSFVPHSGFSGTVAIAYTAYGKNGESRSGTVVIVVGSREGGVVNIETDANKPVQLEADDFNAVFEAENGTPLSSVKFSIPSASYGRLYYNYTSASNYGSAVSSGTKYYRNASPYLSKVTFVPASNYTGSFAISYTAYDSDGDSYAGTLMVKVNSVGGGTVRYEGEEGKPVTFRSEDFQTAFTRETGSSLSYVKFTLPAAASGKLYYNYRTAESYESLVSSSGKYYVNGSPALSKVTFLPANHFSGTVSIPYTAYTSGGTSYVGTLLIAIVKAVPVFDDMEAYEWADEAVRYLFENGIVKGTGAGRFLPQNSLSRGDFTLMIARAFGLTSGTVSGFSDVPEESYYHDAIAAAEERGIVRGTDGKFRPNAAISRQDAMVILVRALEDAGIAVGPGSAGDLYPFADRDQIADYAYDAVAALVKEGVVMGDRGKINPQGSITRAEMAVILYRALTLQE